MAKVMSKAQVAQLEISLKREIDRKVKEFKEGLPKLPELPSVKEKLKLIGKGCLNSVPIEEIGEYTYFHDAYTTSEEQEHEAQEKNVKALRDTLTRRKAEIMENAIFLGAEEALAALKDFRASA